MIELSHVFGVKLQRSESGRLFNLEHFGNPENRDRAFFDRLSGGNLRGRGAVLLSYGSDCRHERSDFSPAAVVEGAAAASRGHRMRFVESSRERPLFKDHVGIEVDAVGAAEVDEAAIERGAVHEAQVVLDGREAAACFAEDLYHALHLSERVVGDADRPDAAFLEKRNDLRRPSLDVRRVVNPVEIDVVGAEPFEALLKHGFDGLFHAGRNLRRELR